MALLRNQAPSWRAVAGLLAFVVVLGSRRAAAWLDCEHICGGRAALDGLGLGLAPLSATSVAGDWFKGQVAGQNWCGTFWGYGYTPICANKGYPASSQVDTCCRTHDIALGLVRRDALPCMVVTTP